MTIKRCSGNPRDLCKSLELWIVQIGLETTVVWSFRNEMSILPLGAGYGRAGAPAFSRAPRERRLAGHRALGRHHAPPRGLRGLVTSHLPSSLGNQGDAQLVAALSRTSKARKFVPKQREDSDSDSSNCGSPRQRPIAAPAMRSPASSACTTSPPRGPQSMAELQRCAPRVQSAAEDLFVGACDSEEAIL